LSLLDKYQVTHILIHADYADQNYVKKMTDSYKIIFQTSSHTILSRQ